MASSNHDAELAPVENERLIELCNEIGLNFNSVKETKIKLDRNGHVIELVICHSMASRLPWNFGSFFPQLRKLWILSCRYLTDISPIGGCRLLEDLDLWICRRVELDAEFWRIKTLRRLVLYDLEDVRVLSPQIGNLTNLEILQVQFCKNLKTLPSEVGLLSKLKQLRIGHCHELTGLPETIGGLSELEKLVFWECSNLLDVPLNFWKLPCLEEVYVRDPQTLREVSVPVIEEFSTSIQQLGSDYARDGNSWWKLCYYAKLNRAGRCLLHQPQVPDTLWSNVFGRCNTASDAREKPKLVNASRRKRKLRNE